MHITVLGGGAAGAQFLADLGRVAGSDVELLTVVPTTNDCFAFGLKSCPDINAVLTACGTVPGPVSHGTKAMLTALEAEPSWLNLDDNTLALDLVRTEMLAAGYALSDITAALAKRLQVRSTIAPMSDERIEHHVVIADDGQRAVHVQEFLAKYSDLTPLGHVFIGIDSAVASEAAIAAIENADLLVFGPSSPVLHLDPMLRLPSLYKAVTGSAAPVLGVPGAKDAHPGLAAIAGVSADAREQFGDIVDAWASGTAAEVLAAGRDLIA